MDLSNVAFEAIKKALLSINPNGTDLTVNVENYYCYDIHNHRHECLAVTDLLHDTGYPSILIYRDAG